MSKYFVLCDFEGSDSFVVSDGTSPQGYDKESEAIAAAKNYSCSSYVMKATKLVTPVERHKVTSLS